MRESKHPYLTGNFAPVSATNSLTPCAYTGRIPRELLGGQYVRNGGNPITNGDLGRDAHWFDGDGMIAGVLFQRPPDDSSGVVPHFVNQYVLTDLCLSSLQRSNLQTPILPSIATLVDPESSLLKIVFRILRCVCIVVLSHLPGAQQPIKRISVANTGVYFHDGRVLATCESGPPMRIQLPDLQTVGWFNGNHVEEENISGHMEDQKDGFGGHGPLSFMREWTTGHPKVDPRTGEMIVFHCNFIAPYVHYSVLPSTKSGLPGQRASRLLNLPVPGCSGGKMMHDAGVSRGHTVILDLPLTLSPFNLLKNRPVVTYEPENPARFGVFPRYKPANIRWFETTGCCIFHTANTWDECDAEGNATGVNMLACRLNSASLVFSAGNIFPTHVELSKPGKNGKKSPSVKYLEGTDLEESSSDESSPVIERLPANNYNNMEPDEEQCRLYYYQFPLDRQECGIKQQYALSAIPFEFPTLNPAYEMSFAKYIYGCSTSNNSFSAALGKATKIDVLVKMDVQSLLGRARSHPPKIVTGCVDSRSISEVLSSDNDMDPISAFQMPESHYAQEARFVARENPVSEDDGYLLFYIFDESQLDEYGECRPCSVSELWIIDAKNMKDLVARVRLPQRVPYGLHGQWFTEKQIEAQRGVDRIRAFPEKRKPSLGWRVMDILNRAVF